MEKSTKIFVAKFLFCLLFITTGLDCIQDPVPKAQSFAKSMLKVTDKLCCKIAEPLGFDLEFFEVKFNDQLELLEEANEDSDLLLILLTKVLGVALLANSLCFMMGV